MAVVTEIKDLGDIQPTPGSRKGRKRVGRGRASGKGKTSTRGHNGQGQRSGEAKRFGFEGGQTPLFRRLPKLHNFDQVITRIWVEINIGLLAEVKAGSEVTPITLVELGLTRRVSDSVRILGNGDLKAGITVKAHHITKGARAKIEAAGGTAVIIEPEPRGVGKKAPKPPKVKVAPVPPEKNAEGEEAPKKAKKEKKADGGGAPKQQKDSKAKPSKPAQKPGKKK
ncbi:MAG: 50S ribosomal protein L15 [Leptolyngbya sp.]|nr:50S ribosomal protein L15 [Candidatus Melainabacteria bacterium]